MNNQTHDPHTHRHAEGCGHTSIRHGNHTDYLHDGHLHHERGGQVAECQLTADATNPTNCTPAHACGAHASGHAHGQGCGHEAIPHGDHTDYLVAGHLHHPHGPHCDDHGKVQVSP